MQEGNLDQHKTFLLLPKLCVLFAHQPKFSFEFKNVGVVKSLEVVLAIESWVHFVEEEG